MSILLYPHNQKAYDSAVDMLNTEKKAAIIHPTGTGKSFIAFKLCEENTDKSICWLSPSEYIFKTQLENIQRVFPKFNDKNIMFITYPKLMLMNEFDIEQIKPDYIIFDEFHRTGALEWGKGVERLLNKYPDIPILGLSATNIRYLDNQRDMAEELFDGNIASEMTLGEAIVRGILNPPKYVLSVFSYQKDFETYKARINKARSKGVRDAAQKYLDALKRALEKADGLDEVFYKHMPGKKGKYIVFCANIEHMQEMISKVPEWFSKVDKSPKVYYAYSDNPETSKSFADFKTDDSNHLKLLFCIDMLNEGIHVDDVSGVILLRPTVSPIIYKQQIGRTLSTRKDYNPIIFDIVLNFENLYSISDIEEEMGEAIDFYRYIGEENEIINKKFNVIDEVRDCKRLFDELEKTLAASWDYMYREAEKYYKENGDLLPSQGYETHDGYKLGQWIVSQRISYRNKTINQNRILKLERIGMSWLTLRERQWEEGFSLAKTYFEKHGNLNVPVNEYPKLSSWIQRQRNLYKTQRITKEQYSRLSDIGMVWELEDTWQQKFEEAKKYYERHGNLDIPAVYVSENGTNLGYWYRSIRNNYRNGTLSEERIKALEEIGIDWTSIKLRTWMNYYNRASEYYKAYGNLNINLDYVTGNGLKLGVWISSQRSFYGKGKLEKEKIELLDKIGMSWHRDKNRWEIGFMYAEEYFNEYCHINVPPSYISEDGYALGPWISTQRLKYRNGKLRRSYINRLNSLNMVWDPADAFWEEGYKHACMYKHTNGDLSIASSFITNDGFKLGFWVTNQRTRYKEGLLSDEQIKKMEEIGFEWSRGEARWNSAYDKAKKFFEKNRNLLCKQTYVTDDGFKLGNWVSSQRRAYKEKKIDKRKIELLEQIGMQWSPNDYKWQIGYEHMKTYISSHNTDGISTTCITPDGYKLGEWLRGQKRMHQKGTLDMKRRKLLEKIGVTFEDNNVNTNPS